MSNLIQKVNLNAAFASFSDHWAPRLAGYVNESAVKLAKLEGTFVWHHHEHEDELFLVISGTLRIQLRDQPELVLQPGEFVIIPRGTEHRPVADAECHVLLFEPSTTRNTGNVTSEHTQEQLDTL